MAAKNPAFKTLISTFGLEAENMRTYEYYDTNELVKMCEGAKIKNKKVMSSRRKRKTSGKADQENLFPKGIAVFEPHRKAPDFVLANIVVNVEDFLKWIESKKGQSFLKPNEEYGDSLNLTLKESKDGNLYLVINTFGTPAEEDEDEDEDRDEDEDEDEDRDEDEDEDDEEERPARRSKKSSSKFRRSRD